MSDIVTAKEYNTSTSHAILDNYINARHFQQNIYISDERNFIYVKNHKAACTTILASLAQNFANEQGEQVEFGSLSAVHKGSNLFLDQVKAVRDLDRILNCLQSDDYLRFTFLRDPVSRVISAYADKVAQQGKIRKRLRQYLGYQDRGEKLTLRDFIYALRDDEDVLNFDRHWRPQVKEISYYDIDYHYIGVVDRLPEELREIIGVIFPLTKRKLFNARKKLDHKTNSRAMREQLTNDEVKILERLYEEDIEAYQKALINPSKLVF